MTKTHFTFIHGISNKPPKEELHRIWLNTLKLETGDGSELDLEEEGVTTSLIYWADIFHEQPLSDKASMESMSDVLEDASAVELISSDILDEEWTASLSGDETKLLVELTKSFEAGIKENEEKNSKFQVLDSEESMERLKDVKFERIPLPWFLKKPIMKQFLMEVHHYLFNDYSEPRPGERYKVKDEIRKRFIAHMKGVDADKHYLLSHSMGTVISYDCLRNVPDCPKVDGFMTIGSPLGLDEVQDKIKPQGKDSVDYPPKVKGKWINVYDDIDVVAFLDKNLSNDYIRNGQRSIKDISVKNKGAWRHSIDKYLKRQKLRKELYGFIS